MQISATMRCYHKPIRMAKIKKITPKVGKDVEK